MRTRELANARLEGYLVLRDEPGPSAAQDLADRVAHLIAQAGPALDAGGGTVYLPGLRDDPLIARSFCRPPLVEALRFLLGGEPDVVDVRYRSPKPRGGGAQTLHRDQPWPLPDGKWAATTVIIGLVEFRVDNGAPRLVAGSHRDRQAWSGRGPADRHPREIHLTGPAGSSFIFTGACLHSGTANHSQVERPGIQVTLVARLA